MANTLLRTVTAASLQAETPPSRGCRPPSRRQRLNCFALQSAVDTFLEVDSEIANSPLDAVTTAGLDAALLGKADASALPLCSSR